MGKVHRVRCPFCKGVLEVHSDTGEILTARSLEEQGKSADDRFEDVFKKMKEKEGRRDGMLERLKEEKKEKAAQAKSLFEEKKKRAAEEPGAPPPRIFDFD